MTQAAPFQAAPLPPEIAQGLDEFVAAARDCFGAELSSAVLFGSAAEGRLRSGSDVNVILLLKRFDMSQADQVRDAFRAAHAAMRLDVMFLLESEVRPVMEAFALKFSDILARRRVLFGPDPFADQVIPPEVLRQQTIQTLLNLMLRMRERYVLVSLREEQLARVAADMAAPLRVCAAAILSLEGRPAASPREALAVMVTELGSPALGDLTGQIATVRSGALLPPGTTRPLLCALMELAAFMYRRISGAPLKTGAS